MFDILQNQTSQILKNKEIKFEVKSDKNKLHSIHFLNKGNFLLIKTCNESEISKIEYESEFDLSYIKKVKLFTCYDSIDECLDEIILGINTGKSSIIEDNNILKLNIPLNNMKFKEILFEIKLKEKSDKDNINELYQIITEQKKEITEQKKEITDLKNKVEILEKNIKELINLKKDEENKINYEISIESKIINDNISYKKCLKNWINKDRIIITDLLYRLSRDGDSVKAFHEMCDNISLTLVLTESNNGNIFGGYTTYKWDNGGDKKDGNTFLFYLTKNKKFKKREDESNGRDVFCGSNYGPFFGRNDFYFRTTLKTGYSHGPFYFLNNKDLADNKENQFDVREVEIYKVSFI